MSLAWRFNISSKDSLWATTIRDKYSTSSANYNSTIWNSLTLGCKFIFIEMQSNLHSLETLE